MYDVHAVASSQGKADEFHRTLVVVLRLDALVFAFQEGEEGFHIHVVLDFLEDGVGDFLRDMLHPEGLLHLAASPFVVLYLVVDEESGKALIVDELLLGQEFHVSGDGILGQFPLLHLVEHFLRAMFGLRAEGSELQQSLLFCHRLLGALGLVVIFHNAFNFIGGIGGLQIPRFNRSNLFLRRITYHKWLIDF